MNFIKKVLMFLLVIVMFIAQFDVAILATSEYPTYSIIEHYFKKQDSEENPRTLWIGNDYYDVYGRRFKFYNPYGGIYLTLNGLGNDDFHYDNFWGKPNINDPIDLVVLGPLLSPGGWDHIVITINPDKDFLENKCLDTLFNILRDNGTITIPIWQTQFYGKSDLQTLEKNLFSRYEWGNTAYMYGQLPEIDEAIKKIYQCDSDFLIKDVHTAKDYISTTTLYQRMLNKESLFFLGNFDECSGLCYIRPRYIVTLQKIF